MLMFRIWQICVGSVIQEKEEEFTRSLYGLQQQPKFNLMLFENEIDKIRLNVAEVCIKLCNIFLFSQCIINQAVRS